jgi:hypothetical protein
MIPGMLEIYERYHEKGLEIVSVYVSDPAATVKRYVENHQIPWIVISEELSRRAGHPEFGTLYNITGVPTLVLVNKEGRVIMPATHGVEWKARLAEIFR